jgi:uncharacterized phage-like protein YoqJ
LGGYQENDLQRWVRNALAAEIKLNFEKGFTRFICGGALGVDWIAAEEVLKHKKAHLILALPFLGYNSVWPRHTIEKFERNILGRANSVKCICDPPFEPIKMQIQNEWMVDQSDLVIAVWDGSGSGTANCVKYALKSDKPVYRINPTDKSMGLWR